MQEAEVQRQFARRLRCSALVRVSHPLWRWAERAAFQRWRVLLLSFLFNAVVICAIGFLLTSCGGGISSSGGMETGSDNQVSQMGVTPSSVSFGSVAAGSTGTQNVSLSNMGTAAVTISQMAASGTGFDLSGISLPLTLSAGQTTSFAAQFSPKTAGNFTGSISVVSNASNSPLSVSLSGTGVTLVLSASPSSVSFGNVVAGSTGTQSVSLSNAGTAAVTISQVGAFGTGFSLSGISLPLTLSPGQATSFAAQFSPKAAGSFTGSISVVSNASNSPLSIALSGTSATLMLSASPSSVSFGNVVIGSTSSLPVVVTNTGSASLTVSQATTQGAGFSVSGPALPLTLATGQNGSFTVSFGPTTAGAATGSLSVISNAADSPNIEALSATGVIAPSVVLAWVASTSPNIAGYNIFRSTVSGGPYTAVNSSLVTGTTYTDTTVQAGQTYYYVTTAVDSLGVQSAYSNQATVTTPSQ